MSWVGIPILMFVNSLHSYMSPFSFNSANTNDQDEKAKIDAKATDRDAIRERMKFFEMTQQHRGKTDKDFPFDATDMARFILRVINGTLPQLPEEGVVEYEQPMHTASSSVLMAEIAELRQQLEYQKTLTEELKIENEFLKKRKPLYHPVNLGNKKRVC